MNNNGSGYLFWGITLIVLSVSSYSLHKYWQKDPDSIVVGVSTDYPPFSSKENNELVGLDIDLAKLVVEKLGKKIVFKEMNFPSLISSLVSGRIDIIASGIAPTKARSEKVDFTRPYHSDSISIVTKDHSLKNITDFKGKIIGVQTGSVAESIAQEFAISEGVNKVSFDLNTQILLSLKSNRIHGLMIATSEALAIIKETKDQQLFSNIIVSLDDSPDGVAMALQKNSPLTKDVNIILEKLEEDGDITKLKNKYNLLSNGAADTDSNAAKNNAPSPTEVLDIKLDNNEELRDELEFPESAIVLETEDDHDDSSDDEDLENESEE